jgi:hypothetical protein
MNEVIPLGAVEVIGRVLSTAAARRANETMVLNLIVKGERICFRATTTCIYAYLRRSRLPG